MSGPYKTTSWNPQALQTLIDDLTAQGLPVQAQWQNLKQPSSPEAADNIQLNLDGKTFLTQRGRKGSVMLDMLTPEQTAQVLSTLYRHAFLVPPSFLPGGFLAVLYALIYVFHTLPFMWDLVGVLGMLSLIFLLGVWIVVIQMREHILGQRNDPIQIWMALPGMLLHVPGILLLLPLCGASFRQALIYRARQGQSHPPAPSGTLQPTDA